MGTRHLIAVVLGGAFKVAQYGQWDGYPSGQGSEVLSFLRGLEPDPALDGDGPGGKMAAFRIAVERCRFGSEDEIKSVWGTEGYGHLSRDTGSDILGLVAEAPPSGMMLRDSSAFAGDGLFCEYAYVIDLDGEKLETYTGFHKGPAPEGERFACFNEARKDEEYGPVRLKASWPLNGLPDTGAFCDAIDPPGEDEEEAA